MRFHTVLLALALLVYGLTAVMSSGYYHGDEHYQIIEFAGILDGSNAPEDLSWEFHQRMRPSLQPVIAHLLFSAGALLGVNDPYSKAMVLRLLTALLSVVTIFHFAHAFRASFSLHYWRWLLVLSYFLWFIPFLSVRFSSETWAGIFLVGGVTLVLGNQRHHRAYALMGALLGLSFLCRYQVAFSVLGLALWLVLVRKESWKRLATAALSFLLILLAGVALDSWFYGSLTLAPLHYLQTNLLKDNVLDFGTSPPYWYFFFVFRYAFFPIGVVLIAAFLVTVWKKWRHAVVWVVLPFFVGHSLIGHKELRFLFPMMHFAPFLVVAALEALALQRWPTLPRKIGYGCLLVLLDINLLALSVAAITPPGEARAAVTQTIHRLKDCQKLEVIHEAGYNPYAPWGKTAQFYREGNARFISTEAVELSTQVDATTQRVLVFRSGRKKDPKVQRIIHELRLQKVGQGVPELSLPFLHLYGRKTSDVLVVYSDR